tara:strand:- start:14642 stop:16252 length:1611 start_codon:yes stop_codon:yes gene_type:complete
MWSNKTHKLFNLSKILYNSNIYEFWLKSRQTETILHNINDPWVGEANLADAIFQGRYNFAGEEINAPNTPLWEPSGVGPWWIAEMHGFSWLRHFKARDGRAARQHARALIVNWIKNGHNKWNDTSWKIDIIGRRISSWIAYADMLQENADRKFIESFFKLLTTQSIHLSKIIKKYENKPEIFTGLRGLLISGTSLSRGEKRYEQAKKILVSSLNKQILNDGCHISCQPSITLDILTDLIWIKNALFENDDLKELIDTHITRISHAIRSLRMGDGTLTRANGGRASSRDAIDKVLEKTGIKLRSKISTSLSISGFERLTAGRSIIILNCTNTENSKYKGTLSFEMSIGRDKLITNCGPSPNNDIEWQKALSSSAAHSTLVIANTNSSSSEKKRTPKITVKREATTGNELISTSHDGYKNIYSAIHKRILKLDSRGIKLNGNDIIISGPKIKFKIHFHVHYRVNLQLTRNKERILLLLPSGGWEFSIVNTNINYNIDIEPSIYLEDNGVRKNTNQFIISGETINSGTQIEWCFKKTTL